MAHERGEIREAFKQALLNRTTAQTRVWKSRTVPLRDLPALGVYSTNEESAELGGQYGESERTLTVAIEGFVTVPGDENAGEDAEVACDNFALEIETAIDQTLRADVGADWPFTSVEMLGTDPYEFANQGGKPIGAIRIEYAVKYRTDLRLESAANPFDEAKITTQVTPDVEDAAVHEVTGINQE